MTQGIAAVPSPRAVTPSLLGASASRIPTAGKIRAGIKVLTRKAAEFAKAVDIYERGVAAGVAFERIEDDITGAIPELKTPLVPKNTPYFTVRSGDFPNPALAGQILDAFGEDRGDGEKRLYRFPVVFPSDAWQSVMPHELVCWGASERKFWSEYSPDGQTRYCKTYAPVPISEGKRALRLFGGRKVVLREENAGVCDPEACKQYQERKCNLSGRFVFFMPGIKSINAFELPTASFYAMNAAIQKFQTIGFMRGGRISGFLDGRNTPFFLSKRLMEVAHIDAEGRAVRVKQWIIELEAPIDLTALLRPDEDHEALELRASQAVSVLEGKGQHSGGPDDRRRAKTERIGGTRPAQDRCARSTDVEDAKPRPAETNAAGHIAARGNTEVGPTAGNGDAEAEVAAICAQAQRLGVSRGQYERYAEKRWGKGWTLNATGRRRARDEVQGFSQDAQAFRAKVHAELSVS